MKRVKKAKASPLERILSVHSKTCVYHVYSGDRHCSCGRNDAVSTLLELFIGARQFVQNTQLALDLDEEINSLRRIIGR